MGVYHAGGTLFSLKGPIVRLLGMFYSNFASKEKDFKVVKYIVQENASSG